MHPLIERLRDRKAARWTLVYITGAGLLYGLMEGPLSVWGIGDAQLRVAQILLVAGFFVAVTVAWYHGERGRQRVSGAELLIIAGILGLAWIGVEFLDEAPPEPGELILGTVKLDPRLPQPPLVGSYLNVNSGVGIALSPAGTRLAYRGAAISRAEGFAHRLFVRDIDNFEPAPVPGSGLALSPAFSPTGRELAFIHRDGGVRVVDLGNGEARTLAENLFAGVVRASSTSLAWSDDNWLYVANGAGNGVHRLRPAGGSVAEQFTQPIDAVRQVLPDALPGGRGLLVTLSRAIVFPEVDDSDGSLRPDSIAVVGPDGGATRTLFAGTMARYLGSGHILYTDSEARLMAVAFDLRSLSVRGVPVPVRERVEGWLPTAQFAVSASGALAWSTRTGGRSYNDHIPVWVARDGLIEPIEPDWVIPAHVTYSSVALSDGDASFTYSLPREGSTQHWNAWDVWRYDFRTGVQAPIQPGVGDINRRGVWAGRDVVFQRSIFANGGRYAGRNQLVRAPADGTHEATVLVEGGFERDEQVHNPVLSPDGEFLIYRTGTTALEGPERCDCVIRAMRLGHDSLGHVIVDEPGGASAPALSPDGKWLAYETAVSGRREIVMRPFPSPADRRIPVSARGGRGAVWAKDGSELFYVDGEGTMIAARIGASVDEPVEDRLELFQASRFMMAADHAGYDVDSEGHRFLMLQEVGDDWTESRVSWVLNFADEVERLVSN